MIVIIGAAGSGKSTQSQLLAANGTFRAVSMGEIFRREITGEDKAVMESGQLMGDDMAIKYLQAELNRIGDDPEVILDGFPRSVVQSEWILNTDYPLRALLHIEINKETAKARLLARGRTDDHETAIEERFREYEAMSDAVIADVRRHGLPVLTVDGNKESLELFEEITQKLASI